MRWSFGGQLLAATAVFSLAVSPAIAQHRGGAMSHMRGMQHDSVSRAQMATIHDLIMNHDRITRSVANLADGIRTITESDDTVLVPRIKEHVLSMIARVESGSDPGWPMQGEALRTLYRNRAFILTRVNPTAKGMVVEQTSTDSATVAALQTHAAEVTALVQSGHAAMHAAMMHHGLSAQPAPGHRPMMMPGPRGARRRDSTAVRSPEAMPHTHKPPPSSAR